MKKNILALALTSLFSFAFAKDYSDLLKKAQDNTNFSQTDFKATVSLVQDIPGNGRNLTDAVMYRRDAVKKWTILITGPALEKGKGYLQFDNNIWFYDPADKCFTFTSSKDSLQNTNATTGDLAPQTYFDDYKIDSTEEVKLGKYDCVLFSLTSKKNGSDYPKIKLWVTKDDGLARKREDYSLSGQKLRTIAFPSYQTVKGISVPAKMLIQDNLKGKKIDGTMQYEKTQITISNVVFEKVSDSVYTKPYLEMMSAK